MTRDEQRLLNSMASFVAETIKHISSTNGLHSASEGYCRVASPIAASPSPETLELGDGEGGASSSGYETICDCGDPYCSNLVTMQQSSSYSDWNSDPETVPKYMRLSDELSPDGCPTRRANGPPNGTSSREYYPIRYNGDRSRASPLQEGAITSQTRSSVTGSSSDEVLFVEGLQGSGNSSLDETDESCSFGSYSDVDASILEAASGDAFEDANPSDSQLDDADYDDDDDVFYELYSDYESEDDMQAQGTFFQRYREVPISYRQSLGAYGIAVSRGSLPRPRSSFRSSVRFRDYPEDLVIERVKGGEYVYPEPFNFNLPPALVKKFSSSVKYSLERAGSGELCNAGLMFNKSKVIESSDLKYGLIEKFFVNPDHFTANAESMNTFVDERSSLTSSNYILLNHLHHFALYSTIKFRIELHNCAYEQYIKTQKRSNEDDVKCIVDAVRVLYDLTSKVFSSSSTKSYPENLALCKNNTTIKPIDLRLALLSLRKAISSYYKHQFSLNPPIPLIDKEPPLSHQSFLIPCWARFFFRNYFPMLKYFLYASYDDYLNDMEGESFYLKYFLRRQFGPVVESAIQTTFSLKFKDNNNFGNYYNFSRETCRPKAGEQSAALYSSDIVPHEFGLCPPIKLAEPYIPYWAIMEKDLLKVRVYSRASDSSDEELIDAFVEYMRNTNNSFEYADIYHNRSASWCLAHLMKDLEVPIFEDVASMDENPILERSEHGYPAMTFYDIGPSESSQNTRGAFDNDFLLRQEQFQDEAFHVAHYFTTVIKNGYKVEDIEGCDKVGNVAVAYEKIYEIIQGNHCKIRESSIPISLDLPSFLDIDLLTSPKKWQSFGYSLSCPRENISESSVDLSLLGESLDNLLRHVDNYDKILEHTSSHTLKLFDNMSLDGSLNLSHFCENTEYASVKLLDELGLSLIIYGAQSQVVCRLERIVASLSQALYQHYHAYYVVIDMLDGQFDRSKYELPLALRNLSLSFLDSTFIIPYPTMYDGINSADRVEAMRNVYTTKFSYEAKMRLRATWNLILVEVLKLFSAVYQKINNLSNILKKFKIFALKLRQQGFATMELTDISYNFSLSSSSSQRIWPSHPAKCLRPLWFSIEAANADYLNGCR